MLILGIDDAGRGPVIGPMILAGCLMSEEAQERLKKIGVKDSKQLTQKRREFLENKIINDSENFEVVSVLPEEIDSENHKGVGLNEVEAFATARIINKINKGKEKIKVIVDCPSVSIVKWTDFLKTKVDNLSNLEVSCEHKADKNHVAVAAASILAKQEREREMKKIRENYGDGVGSGYCSDPLTCKFLGEHVHKYKDHGIFRKTWKTYKNASQKALQTTLD
jgi:ribonuclease HII